MGAWRSSNASASIVRNGTAGARREPGGVGSDQPEVDREGGIGGHSATGRAGDGQSRDPGLRPTGAQRLQRALRIDALSPRAAVQSRG